MKKVLSTLLLIAISASAFAQFITNSDGTVRIGPSQHRQNSFTTAKVNVESYMQNANNKDLIAIQGAAYMTNSYSWDKAVGVFGIAGNGGNGHNMGVLGYLGGDKYGAAVFGSTNDNLNYYIPGQYAGFFYGDVRATGSITCSSVNTTSDLRLKDNVLSVKDIEGDYRYLDRILDMNVIEYNLIDKDANASSDSNESAKKVYLDDQRHIGLAAQELKELFPDLVVEDKEGYMAVNYVELVPVLIRSIQELKQELDEAQGKLGKSRGTTDITGKIASECKLYQNSPNPARGNTTIRFKLADGILDAFICIFDLQGKLMKKLPISSTDESVTVNGIELGEGLYLYSLIANGQEIDTKKMIITK